jgi:hypothetical protein
MRTKLHPPFGILHSAFILAFLALSPVTSHANVLANPSFESGSDGRVLDLARFGNTWQATNHARSGACALKLSGNWSGPWNASSVVQTLAASPGRKWTLSGYGLTPSGDALAAGYHWHQCRA